MNERERRGRNSNPRNLRSRAIARSQEDSYSGSSGTDESVLQYTSRSYEELRARDEELFYKEDEDWTFITEEEYQAQQLAQNSLASISNDGLVTGDKESETVPQQSELSDEELIASLPAVFPGIPASVATRFSARLGTRELWRAFGKIVARRFGERAVIALGLSAGDGPLPIGEIISLGLAAATVWEVYQLWDELWAETEAELSNPNSEIIVTVEPENQVYTTPNEEQGGIEHTGGVPPQVETGTPGFDTEAGREIESQQNTGGQTRQQPDARDFVMEWSPSMTPAEADEYTKDSHYADQTFYHGTDVLSGQNISESGVDPAFFNELSNYGTGFYTARNQDGAREYAELTAEETGQQQALLRVKLKANNPVIFGSGVDFSVSAENYVRERGLTNVEPADAYGKYLQSQGYDAIEIEALGYVVVFKTEQVVVTETEVIE